MSCGPRLHFVDQTLQQPGNGLGVGLAEEVKQAKPKRPEEKADRHGYEGLAVFGQR